MYLYITATCSKKKHCGRSQASKSRKKRVFTAQHSTAQRMTARRSVIHPSSCPSSVLVTVHPKKKPKLIQPGKTFRLMFGIFPEFGGLLQDAGRFYQNFRSKSKTPVGNHFGPHGTLRASRSATRGA